MQSRRVIVPSPRCAFRHFPSSQVSLNDGLFGVGTPEIADINIVSMQPIVTFEDYPDALHK
jgi:hypothetical protein